MNILQLGKFYPIQGGVEKVMLDLTIGLTERYPEVKCDMLCVSADGQPYTEKLNERARVITTKLNKKLFSTMLSVDIISRLRSICDKYDLIHIHHPDPMVALALRLSGYKGKVILHWHSDILKQKTLLKLYRPLQNWLIKRADVIIGTTQKYLDESPHLKNFSINKHVLPIGILPVKTDINEIRALKEKYSNKHIIFSLGRLVGYKGFQYLIDAAKFLPDDYVVIIGGSGPLKDELNNQIVQNHLQHKVILSGRISDEDLPSYYGASDLFVLSSIWKTEAFGIVQIEAMSCGKPVVATHIPESGVDWVNEDGYSGENVVPENAQAIANAILKITHDKDKYNTYCNNAFNRFNKFFTLDGMVQGCMDIYRKVLLKNAQ